MLCTSASVVWFSQYAQLLLMTVTPSVIIAVEQRLEAAPRPERRVVDDDLRVRRDRSSPSLMSSSTSVWSGPSARAAVDGDAATGG